MSGEFERTLSAPLELTWNNSADLTPTMRYRMIDAPLTRYLIGFSRILAGIPSPENDWDWSATWQENVYAGAYPESRTLVVARLSVAFLFPFSLLLLYLIGLKLQGRFLGIAAVLLFSFHPLILLHTRRAMAEGVLIFTVLLVLYTLFYAERHPFLAGLAVALAFNAKHSAALLLPIGLFAAGWTSWSSHTRFGQIVSNLMRFTVGFILITLLLNPYLWRNPFSAIQTALVQRNALLERQLDDFMHIAPAQVLDGPGKRAAVAAAQVFIAPPVFAEVGNYAEFTEATETAYLESSSSQTGRQPWWAGLLIGISLLGLMYSFRVAIEKHNPLRRDYVIFLLSFLSISIGTASLVHLAWQRYYLPLVPFIALLAGLGLVWGIKTSHAIFSHGRLFVRLSEILTQFTPNSRVP